VDRPVETVVETYVEQPVIEQPAFVPQYTEPLYTQPIDAGGVTLLPQAEPPVPHDPADTLRLGDAAFAAGDYAQARRHYIQAQLEGAYAGEGTLAYGLARFAEGYYAVSALALRRGLAEVPDAIDYPLDITLLYGDQQSLEQQLDALTEHLGRQPDDSYAWFVLGYVRFGKGDPPGAVQAFERCIALDPQDVLAHLLRESALAAPAGWPPPAADADPAAPSGGGSAAPFPDGNATTSPGTRASPRPEAIATEDELLLHAAPLDLL
jgi:tetratricopeptide (TPR) repeat protein